jgi:hypothetical protein
MHSRGRSCLAHCVQALYHCACAPHSAACTVRSHSAASLRTSPSLLGRSSSYVPD